MGRDITILPVKGAAGRNRRAHRHTETSKGLLRDVQGIIYLGQTDLLHRLLTWCLGQVTLLLSIVSLLVLSMIQMTDRCNLLGLD